MSLSLGARALSALCGVVLVMGAIASRWWIPVPANPVQLTELDRQFLMSNSPDQFSDWLSNFSDRLPPHGAGQQALILQAVPQEAPYVIAAVQDADGDEERTHWPVPWEPVVRCLSESPPESAVTVFSQQHGFQYRHQLIPIGSDGRYVLVNDVVPVPSWTGWRAAAIFAGLTLTAVSVWSERT